MFFIQNGSLQLDIRSGYKENTKHLDEKRNLIYMIICPRIEPGTLLDRLKRRFSGL